MNEITTYEQARAFLELPEYAPAVVSVGGKTRELRAARIFRESPDGKIAAQALLKSKVASVRKAAAAACGEDGVVNIIERCSLGDYRSFAAWLAPQLDCTVLIRTRAEYLMQDFIIEGKVRDAQNKGTASGNKQALALEAIRAEVKVIQDSAQEIFMRRIAEAKARKEAERLEQEAGIETEQTEEEATA